MAKKLGCQLGLVLLTGLLPVVMGCTKDAWFQGFVEGQKYQCYKLDGQDRSKCLESINYDLDRYQLERNEYLQRAK